MVAGPQFYEGFSRREEPTVGRRRASCVGRAQLEGGADCRKGSCSWRVTCRSGSAGGRASCMKGSSGGSTNVGRFQVERGSQLLEGFTWKEDPAVGMV